MKRFFGSGNSNNDNNNNNNNNNNSNASSNNDLTDLEKSLQYLIRNLNIVKNNTPSIFNRDANKIASKNKIIQDLIDELDKIKVKKIKSLDDLNQKLTIVQPLPTAQVKQTIMEMFEKYSANNEYIIYDIDQSVFDELSDLKSKLEISLKEDNVDKRDCDDRNMRLFLQWQAIFIIDQLNIKVHREAIKAKLRDVGSYDDKSLNNHERDVVLKAKNNYMVRLDEAISSSMMLNINFNRAMDFFGETRNSLARISQVTHRR